MKIAAGIVGFMGGTAALALMLGVFRGAVLGPDAAIALWGGAVFGAVSAWAAPRGLPRRWGWGDGITAVAFWLFAIRSFSWLAYPTGDSIRFASAYNLGDLSLHVTLIEHIASGAAFWPDNPIFPGRPLRYPVGVDLFNAAMVAAGADLWRSLAWVGFAGMLAVFLSVRRWGGAFAVAALLFNGGLAGFDAFRTLQLSDYQSEMAWKSIALTMLVPQRGLLYALPAGLLLLASWRERFFGGTRTQPDGRQAGRPLPGWFELFVYATMPLFHVHTFLFLSAMLAGIAAFASPAARWGCVRLAGMALLPAAALVFLVAGFGEGAAGIHWKPGWMQDPEAPLWFWVQNFGATAVLVPVLVAMAAAGLRGGKGRETAAFVLTSAAVFALSCFLMLSRWEWDNTKLMLWCYLVLMAYLWAVVLKPLSAWARAAACALLFLSGAVTLAGGMGRGTFNFLLVERPEMDGVRSALRPLSPGAVFAAAPEPNHPLLLSGRKCLVGYPGHLWSYGIPYEERHEKLRALMLGAENWRELAAELGADYLFWGRPEDAAFAGSKQPWCDACPTVASGPWGTIFSLREPPPGG